MVTSGEMSVSFETQPPYIQLRNICSERTSKLVAFVGSGLSFSAGLPTWPGLKNGLVDDLAQKAESFSEVDRKELLRKKERIVAEKNNWNAFGLLHNALGRTTYVFIDQGKVECC